jgi:chromosome segregation ATPase
VRLYELRLQIEESQQRIKALEQQIQKLQQERSEQKQKMEGLRKEEQELHKEFMQPAEGDYDVQVSFSCIFGRKIKSHLKKITVNKSICNIFRFHNHNYIA